MSSSMSSGKILKLKSKDNEILEVEESVAMKSHLIKNIVEDGCASGVIPLFNVHGKTLTNIIEWCRKHVADYNIEEQNNVVVVDQQEEEALKDWESRFVDVDTDSLYELFMAANYLNIQKLLNRVAKQIADIITSCKTVEEIRQTFGIKNDFTAEEEEQIRKQNSLIDL